MALRPAWSLVAILFLAGTAGAAGGTELGVGKQQRPQLRLIGGNAQVRRLLRGKIIPRRHGGSSTGGDEIHIQANESLAAKNKGDHTPLILSLGGEGEVHVPGATVLDVNLLDDQHGYVMRKTFVKERRNPIVQADMTSMPFRANTADGVIGNRVPFHASFAPLVATEALRVLKRGAKFKVFSVTGGAKGWIPFLTKAGFTDIHVEGPHLVGTKP